MIRLVVKVKPNAKVQKVEAATDGSWVVHVKAPPVDGKANAELTKLLAQQFAVSKSKVFIKSGLSSKQKLVEIETDT